MSNSKDETEGAAPREQIQRSSDAPEHCSTKPDPRHVAQPQPLVRRTDDQKLQEKLVKIRDAGQPNTEGAPEANKNVLVTGRGLDQAEEETDNSKRGVANAGSRGEDPKDSSAQIKLEEVLEEEGMQGSEEAVAG